MGRRRRWPRITRDGLTFTIGVGGILYETIRQGAERPSLLMLFAMMVGLPAFFQADERRERKKGR